MVSPQRHPGSVLQHEDARDSEAPGSISVPGKLQARKCSRWLRCYSNFFSNLQNTDLYKEIKYLSGHAPDSEPPSDQWSLQKILQDRENGIGRKPAGTLSENQYRKIANQYIPNKKSQRLMSLESKVFCGTFNKSGSRLITASQGEILNAVCSGRDVDWAYRDDDLVKSKLPLL